MFDKHNFPNVNLFLVNAQYSVTQLCGYVTTQNNMSRYNISVLPCDVN